MNEIKYERFVKSLIFLAIFLTFLRNVESTITPGGGGKSAGQQQKPIKLKVGPRDESVFDLDLIDDEPAPREIIINSGAYYRNTSVRNFDAGEVLAYVTPWNSHGYDVAKIFAQKFDIISPVWFQIKKEDEHYILNGAHDIDTRWMADVRRKGRRGSKTVKFFPRFIFQRFTNYDFTHLLKSAEEREKVATLITRTCFQHKFDGIVLEYWQVIAGVMSDDMMMSLALDVSKALKEDNLGLILVIPPVREELPNPFTKYHFNKLYKHVYGFSLMTYDYSSVHRPGANSPLFWIEQSIEKITPPNASNLGEKRKKILMGMNMYGMDYTGDGGGALLANKYLELLQGFKKRLAFDDFNVEHYFEPKLIDSGRHYVFYPTLYSINERLKFAKTAGVGVSIWEIGQGLDYFYDLF